MSSKPEILEDDNSKCRVTLRKGIKDFSELHK